MLSSIPWRTLPIAAIFLSAGVAHFVSPAFFLAIMPRFLPLSTHASLVFVSGVFEILGAIGVLLPVSRRWAGIGLSALLVGVFPANVQMLASAYEIDASALYRAGLWLRLPLQLVLLSWVWRVTAPPKKGRPLEPSD